MVQLGETRALGGNPEGTPFAVNLVDPRAPWRTDRVLPLADAALAVSGGYTGAQVIDPATGQGAHRLADVTVVAPRAVWADALSTAILVAGEGAAPRLLAATPGARALVTRPDGSGGWIG
jgi:thiamine biosynthesis lipoprotein